jgi:hypothetical protein
MYLIMPWRKNKYIETSYFTIPIRKKILGTSEVHCIYKVKKFGFCCVKVLLYLWIWYVPAVKLC